MKIVEKWKVWLRKNSLKNQELQMVHSWIVFAIKSLAVSDVSMMIHDKLLIPRGDESVENTVETAALLSFDREVVTRNYSTRSMCHPTRACLSRCGWVVDGRLLELWWWWRVGGWFVCVVCVCVV